MSNRYVTFFVSMAVLLSLQQVIFAAPVELSLDDSIALGLKNNYDIKYAKSAREKSYWSLSEAEKNKKLSLDYAHSDQSEKNKTSSGFDNRFSNTLTLTLPLYSGHTLENKIEQGKLSLQVADLDVDAAKQQIKLDVITKYLTVLEYRNELDVNQESVNNYTDHLNLVQSKYDLGMVAKTDVLASQVDLANAQDTLIQSQNNYNNAIAALNNAIGLPHETELTLKEGFTYKEYPRAMDECLAYAIEHRTELAQYKAKIASAQYDVQIAKGNKLPTVDLSVVQGWNDTQLPGMENSDTLLKLTASLNVFDSGRTNSQIKQAEHNVDMVNDNADKERDAILLDVRQYYLSMKEAEKRIDTNKVSVNQAQENLDIQKVRYEVGVGTNLDLLDAVLALNSARKNEIQALYDYNTNKAKLEQAMGMPVE